MSTSTQKKDLTRWNRAGLSRLRYVDGNAVTYLEALRLAMREEFSEGGVNRWQDLDTAIPVPPAESDAERERRLLYQYRADRRDYGWEVLRAFGRASHVLTEHLDAYANEGYLRTATQWENLRRLVEMLDYHPAPPASAETWIALLAKPGKTGTVAEGFAFKNKPDDGSKPVVFETLGDLEVDDAMNELRPAAWNESQEPFVYADGTLTATFPLSEPVTDVSVGTLGVLLIERPESDPVGVAVSVTGVSDEALELQGEAKPVGFPSEVKRHQVRLLLQPGYKQAPQWTGSNVVVLNPDHGLSLKAVVAWQDGSSWVAAQVNELDGGAARLSRAAPAAGTPLYLATYSDAQDFTIGGSSVKRVILPAYVAGNREEWAIFDASLERIHSFSTHNEAGAAVYDYVSGTTSTRVYYLPTADGEKKPAATVQRSDPQELTLKGDPGNLASGGWLSVQTGAGNRAAAITALTEGEKDFRLELSRTLSDIQTLFGDWALDLRPRDQGVNTDPVFVTDPALRSDAHSILPLAPGAFPTLLDVGRTLIIAGEGEAMAVTVKEIDEEAGRIRVAPAIPGSEPTGSGTTDVYTRYHTTLYGNVAPAGHGERQNEKILGSGDAVRSGQTFAFSVEEVSFVADRGFASGVRAAVEVSVAGRTWKQVDTLNDSEPEDPHYLVRMTEDGTLTVVFGDGRYGRRLPTGNNNVRIGYRRGTGLAGNLSPESLVKEVKPHHLVDGLRQPIATTGGNDLEAVESMRRNAPASILALERAVSLSDFTHLAAASSSVWQARAFRRQPGFGRADRIEVAVVPAGGGSLGSLKESLEEVLTSHALPNVAVSVVGFQSLILDLALTLRVKRDEYDPDLVADAVKKAVSQAFALRDSSLGETFYLSRVVAEVEAVAGVENCHCVINPDGFRDAAGSPAAPRSVGYGPDGAIRRVSLKDEQVLYLDEDRSVVEITTQEYSL